MEELKKELLNEELDFFKLDTIMNNNGYYGIITDGAVKNIIECENVVFTNLETGEAEIKINFDIVELADEKKEAIEATIIKIRSIEKF